MRNIFNIIFILIIGYIISRVFFSNDKLTDHFDTLVSVPSPGPDLSAGLVPSPAPGLTDLSAGLVPSPAPGPSPSDLITPSPAPGPAPLMVNGVNMNNYISNYYSLLNAKQSQGQQTISTVSIPSFYMLDLLKPGQNTNPAQAPTPQNETIKVVKKTTPEQAARSEIGTVKFQTEFSKVYPIGTNFDPIYSNYSNLISNTSIGLLNDVLSAAKFKANQNSQIINFNPGLKQVKSLLTQESDILEYAKYIVSVMNTVSSIGNSFVFVKANPIVKEQYENQMRVNFTIETIYKYPKSKDIYVEIAPDSFTLLLNVVILFEKSYSNPTSQTYLETLGVIGLSNFGYLSGYSKPRK